MGQNPAITTTPVAAETSGATPVDSTQTFGKSSSSVIEECRRRMANDSLELRDFYCVDLSTSTPEIRPEQYVIIANDDLRSRIPEDLRDKFSKAKYNSGTDSVISERLNLTPDSIPDEGVRMAIRLRHYMSTDSSHSSYEYKPENADRPIEISIQNGKGVNIFKKEPVPAHVEYVSAEDFPKRLAELAAIVTKPNVPDNFFDKMIQVEDGKEIITPRTGSKD